MSSSIDDKAALLSHGFGPLAQWNPPFRKPIGGTLFGTLWGALLFGPLAFDLEPWFFSLLIPFSFFKMKDIPAQICRAQSLASSF